jgi:hypothetical protein
MWKIVDKKAVPHERKDGNYLTLVVEKDGRREEAIVDGRTYWDSIVGDKVDLPGLDMRLSAKLRT